MAFRRSFRRRRFRKSPYDMQRLVQCRRPFATTFPSSCASPFIDSYLLAGVTSALGPASPVSKGLTFGGCHFQSEYAINNANAGNASIANTTEIFSIVEAVMVLPYAVGVFGIPAYLPPITNNAFTGGDLSDRILWQRLSLIPFIGLAGGFFLATTDGYQGHGPVSIRAKATLDERHGVFYLAALTSGFTDSSVVFGANAWWNIAVKERRR